MDETRDHGTSWIRPSTLMGRLGALLVALIVAATAVASVLDYRQDRDLAIERARRELQAQTDLVAERLGMEVHDRHRAMDLWPELEAAQELAVDDLDRRLSASLLQLTSSFGTHDLALGLGPQGTTLASSDARLIGENLGQSRFFTRLDSILPISLRGPTQDSALTVVDVTLFPNRAEEGLPISDGADPSAPVVAFSHMVTSWGDGRPLGWIVLLTPWATLVDSSARDLGSGLLIREGSITWYEGDSIRGRAGPWVSASRPLGSEIPGAMTVSLRLPVSVVLEPLHGAIVRLVGLAALFLLAVVPPLLLLLSATLKELRHLTQTATAMDPDSPGSFGGVSDAAPHEVRILASALSGMMDRLNLSRRELARRESLAAVGVLAAGLAHEIRTPLSVLRASAEMLDRDPNADTREHELVSFIQEEVGRLARLVDDLLLFARPRAPELDEVALDELLMKTVRALSSQAKEEGVSLEVDPTPVKVLGDAEQLYQVGLNLLGNALHVSDSGGVIRLSTREEEGMGWLTVDDEGPGIDADDLERIWDPLFTTRTSGTGLGLAVVKRIVEEHKGRIRVDSTPGEGARFSVGFPLLSSSRPQPGGGEE